MEDQDKTKEQFMNELAELRQRVAELEAKDTECKRAEDEVRRHLERVEALREIDRTIASTLDLTEVLNVVLDELERVIPYHSAGIFLLSNGTAKLTTGRGFPDLERALQVSFPVQEDALTREVLQQKRPLVLADAQADERFLARGGTEYVRSWIGVPLIAKGEATGFLTIDHREPGVYDEQSAEIAQGFASQAAIAIENARLFQESQRRAEEMAALREVSLATLSTLERDQVFEIMLDQLGAVIDYDTAAIKIITPDGRDKMIVGRGPIIYDQAMWNGFDVKDNKLLQEMEETKQAVVVHDTQTDERYKKVGNWEAFPSWVGAPLFVKGGFIGYLAVEKTSPGFYDESAVQLLGDFAHAAAIALENARLYEGIRQELAERKRAEEELRESEAKYRELADSIADVFFAFDKDLRYTYWNKASEKLTGIPVKDAIGKSLYELFPDTPETRRAERAYLDVLRMQQPQSLVNSYHIGGRDFFFEISAYPSERGLSVFVKDITERKRAEEELRQSYVNLQRALEGTVHVLVSAIEMRDPYTAGHQRRVTQLACAVANEMGLPEEQIQGIRMAGLIHDLGKINVPAEILSKPGRLTELEFGLIKMHPQVGHDVLNGVIEFPWPVAQMVLQHHERMDGSGYPQGLSGDETILEARILGVADVIEAMASHRPYRSALGIDKALEEISQNKGVLYDPEVVDVCLKLFTEKGFEFE